MVIIIYGISFNFIKFSTVLLVFLLVLSSLFNMSYHASFFSSRFKAIFLKVFFLSYVDFLKHFLHVLCCSLVSLALFVRMRESYTNPSESKQKKGLQIESAIQIFKVRICEPGFVSPPAWIHKELGFTNPFF